VTSEARARPRDEEEATTAVPAPSDPADQKPGASDDGAPDTGTSVDGASADETADEPTTGRRSRGRRGSSDGDDGSGPSDRSRLSLPLIPVLLTLLVLLLAAVGYLWFTRPGESAVRTDDYAAALQQARSEIVDYTSFDYLTLDDDIEQIRRVSVGDLRDSGVEKLDSGRAQITQAEFVVSTEVVGAGLTRVDGDEATVLMVLEATERSAASQQAQISRYSIEVSLEKSDGRWMLSGLKGTGSGND